MLRRKLLHPSIARNFCQKRSGRHRDAVSVGLGLVVHRERTGMPG
jgi:hypothetical protein